MSVVLAGLLALPAAGTLASGSGTISGTAYKDVNRDGVQQADESALADQLIYLFDGVGTYLKNSKSDASGRFTFAGLASGDYRVEYATGPWRELREDWVPTTTGSIFPRVTVALAGHASVDFGWREIVRTRDLAAPISTYVGANGMRVESFNDVVPAKEIYDAVMDGTVGQEAQFVTIRFDYSDTANTAISYQSSNGVFHSYKAVTYDNWISWLTKGDSGVSHEYGHAWSIYFDTIVQQNGHLSNYLRARGLEYDERVNSSYAWSARELVAEDYRQLLGSPNAQKAAQMNSELPPASEVSGLKDFLELVFTVPPTADPPPPESEPSPSPEPATTLQVADPVVNPAPVVQSATVSSSISAAARVTIEIRSPKGQLVQTLVTDAALQSGYIEAQWDRRDARGRKVKGGNYVALVVAVAADGTVVRSQTTFYAQ